jgi:7-carboxy-7-deazaguanine synthase
MTAPTRLPTTPLDVAHRLAPLAAVAAGDLLIHEIYLSVQGESTYAGLPCVFVRTSVCDLRCSWCDTPQAFNRGERMTRAGVLDRVRALNCPLVEVTGGEPLLQPEVLPLMAELADAGMTVLLETSGAHDVTAVDPRVVVILDVKCPDSGEEHRNHWPNLDRIKPTDEIKFVVASERDWKYAEAVIRDRGLDGRCQVLVSAVFGKLEPRQLVEWLLASGLRGVRMQVQMHKVIWEPTTRGV